MFSPKQTKSSYIVNHSKKNKPKKQQENINTSIDRNNTMCEDKNENGRIYNKKFCNCCIIN